MKILICTSSQIRSGSEECFNSMVNRMIRHLPVKPDIIGHFESSSDQKFVKILENVADTNIFKFEDDPEFTEKQLNMKRNMCPHQAHGIKGNLFQWNNMLRCLDMKNELEAEKGKYDIVIWTRPDIYYLSDINPVNNFKKNTYFVPFHDSWKDGLNDRFCYGDSDIIGHRMNMFNFYTKRWYPNNMDKYNGPRSWNPEVVLLDRIKHIGAEIQKIPFTANIIKKHNGYLYMTKAFYDNKHFIHDQMFNNKKFFIDGLEFIVLRQGTRNKKAWEDIFAREESN